MAEAARRKGKSAAVVGAFMVNICEGMDIIPLILLADLWLLQRGWSLSIYGDENAQLQALFWDRRSEDLQITGSLQMVSRLSPWAKK